MSLYGWIMNNKKIVLMLCVVLIIVLIVNMMSSHDYAKDEAELKEEEAKIEEMKRKRIQTPIDHRSLGEKHYKLWNSRAGDVIQHYIKAIQYFEILVTSGQADHEVLFKLGKLYHIGVSDGYARNEQKNEGVSPNPQKAIFFYMSSAQLGNPEGLLSVADLYRWGLQEIKPNVEYAKQLYLILRQTGDEYYKGIAKDRILQIKEDDGSVIGSGVDAGNFNTQFHEAYENYGQGTLDEDFDVNLDHKNDNVKELMQNLKLPQYMNKVEITTTDDKGNNNPHNVTDHILDNTIKQIWTKLKANTPQTMTPQTVLLDIKRWILAQRGNEDKKQDALLALAEISSSVDSRMYEETKEIDAIVLVWNRIHANVNAANKNILKLNLFNELAECVEHGEVVCRQGRISRMFDALNMIDPDVQIKPKWAVNEEMKNYAIKLKNDSLKSAAAHIRDAANAPWPSPEQVELLTKFNEKFKRDLIELFHKKYVDTGCMSSDLLKTELKKWIEHI